MSSVIIRPGLFDRLQKSSGIESEAAMARTINVSQETLSGLKNGESPSLETIASIVNAFGLSLGEVACLKRAMT